MSPCRGRSSSARCSIELDTRHKFEPPPSLVEEEFDRVWKSVLSEMETEKKTFEDEDTTEEKAKAEYRAIAERRVRLGLVLAEIGEKNNITVTEEELSRAVMERARQFPARSSGCGITTGRTRRRSPRCARRSSRKRWSISCSNSPSVTEKKVAREELYKEDEATAA